MLQALLAVVSNSIRMGISQVLMAVFSPIRFGISLVPVLFAVLTGLNILHRVPFVCSHRVSLTPIRMEMSLVPRMRMAVCFK